MKTALKILIGLFCLPLIVVGVTSMVNPTALVETFAVNPVGTDGLATIRGSIGGLLVGISIMMMLGLFQRNTFWFLGAAIMIGVVLFGRVLGIVFDGVGPDIFQHVAMEIVIVILLVLGHRHLSHAQ